MTTTPACPIERARQLLQNHISIGIEHYKTWNTITFSVSGAARVGSILGYGLALCDSGVEHLAAFGKRFLNDFFDAIDRLAAHSKAKDHFDQTEQLTRTFGYETYAPSRRVAISDDGTLHGLSFAVYYLVRQDLYESGFDAFRLRYLARQLRSTPFAERHSLRKAMLDSDRNAWRLQTIDAYHKETNIRADLTPKYQHARYRYSFNGGLLYHGSGSNPFAVSLSSRLFATHT